MALNSGWKSAEFHAAWTQALAEVRAESAPQRPTRKAAESRLLMLRERILVIVEQSGPCSTAEVAEALDLPVYRVAGVIKMLKNRHALVQRGYGNAAVYAVPDARVVPFRAVG